MSNQQESKVCSTCRFENRVGSAYPCRSCIKAGGRKDKWAPKLTDKDKGRTCSTCRFDCSGNCPEICFRDRGTPEYHTMNPGWKPKRKPKAAVTGKAARSIVVDDVIATAEVVQNVSRGAADVMAKAVDKMIIQEGSALSSTHYQVGSKQPIEIMQETFPAEQFIGFLRGNVLKYTLRMGNKDASEKEAAKVVQYSKWLLQALKGETINPREG